MHQVRISLDHEIKIMVILKTYPDKHGVYLRQVILPFGQDFIELDFCLKGEYDDAQELYEDGLLIYTTSDFDTTIEIDGVVDYDRYICFKSGRAQKTFVDKAGSLGFVAVDSSPKLKMIQKEWKGYSRVPYDENKWVKQ